MSDTGGIHGATDQWDWEFFVSYADADRMWAEWMSWQLEAAGYRVSVKAWDSVAGSKLIKIGEGCARARHVIVLFSDAYLATVYERDEWLAALRYSDWGEFNRKLLPIRVENRPLPKALHRIIESIDLFWLDEDDARKRLIEEIKKAIAGRGKPPSPPVFPGVPATSRPKPPFPDLGKGATGRAIVERVDADVAAGPEVFVGRSREVGKLVELLNPAGAGPTTVAVVGPGGMGKTALARQAAVKANGDGEDLFPGGVFITDLHGYSRKARFGPGQVYAGQVYASLLAGLRPGEQIPATVGKQAAVYRQVLAERAEHNKPVLLVLDNVAHPNQIAGLLPAHRAHRVLVTSRNTLGYDDRDIVNLDVLDLPDAVTLLGEMLHRRDKADMRVPQEPDSAEDLAERCGRWPLALRIAAALLAVSPGRSIADLVADLAKLPAYPDRLDDGENDGQKWVDPVLELSWNRLTRCDPFAAELFWLLSVNPGPEISTDAAAALAGWQPWVASWNLRKLHRAELVKSATAAGRWGMHDVVGSFADRLPKPPSITDTHADAFDRLLRYYQTEAADRAGRAGWFLLRHSRPAEHPSPPHGWRERKMALAWFTTEQPNLFGCVHAVKLGPDAVERGRGAALLSRVETVVGRRWNRQRGLVALVDAMAGYLRNNGPWEKAAEMQRLAADTAERLGDTRAQGIALNDLGITCRLLGLRVVGHPQAVDVLEQARQLFHGLRLFHRRIALLGQANALNEQGIVHNEEGDYGEARKVLGSALRLYRKVPDDIGIANASKNLGVAIYNIGLREDDPLMREAAQEPLNEALVQYKKIGDKLGIAEVRNHIGRLWLKSNQTEMALDEFKKARKLAGKADSLLEEAKACEGIGDCQAASNNGAAAICSFESAQDSYLMIGAGKQFDHVTTKLDDLRRARSTPGSR